MKNEEKEVLRLEQIRCEAKTKMAAIKELVDTIWS